MKFRYFRWPLPQRDDFFGTSILKPIIPVRIAVAGNSLRYAALIDSGADFCIFDAEVGERLGLNVRAGRPISFGGIQAQGGADAFLHPVTLTVGGRDYNVLAGFSYDIAKRGFGVLGQKGFFDIFVVKFDLSKEEIELIQRKK